MFFSSEQYKQIEQLVGSYTRVLIATHQFSDGDSLGSSFAMGYLLEHHQVEIDYYTPVMPGKIFAPFVPLDKLITNIDDLHIGDYDAIIVMDTGGRDTQLQPLSRRIGDDNPCPLIVIDHHRSNSVPADHAFVVTHASSTCEIMYDIYANSYPDHINETTATMLLLGIITDTGNFTRSLEYSTFEVVTNLIRHGGNREAIVEAFFLSQTREELQTLGSILSQLQQTGSITRIAYVAQEYENKTINIESLNNLVKDNIQKVTNTDIKVVFVVYDTYIRCNFRSKTADVADITSTLFGGGGHKHAAGAKILYTDDHMGTITATLQTINTYINS